MMHLLHQAQQRGSFLLPHRCFNTCHPQLAHFCTSQVLQLLRQHHSSRAQPHHPFRASCIASEAQTTTEQQANDHLQNVTVLGQVISAQANYVRVRVDALVPPGAPQGPLQGPPEGPEDTQTALDVSQAPVKELLCTVRALLKKMKQSVLVGDKVRVGGIDWSSARGVVEAVFPRTSELTDPSVANVDHTLLVFTFALPPFEPPNVTRYLVAAEATGLPLTVVVNKADVVDAEAAEAVLQQVRSWGYDAVPVSTITNQGIPELAELLRNKVAVLAGPSGVGKSSIINAMRLHAARAKPGPTDGQTDGQMDGQTAQQAQHTEQDVASSSAASSGESGALEIVNGSHEQQGENGRTTQGNTLQDNNSSISSSAEHAASSGAWTDRQTGWANGQTAGSNRQNGATGLELGDLSGTGVGFRVLGDDSDGEEGSGLAEVEWVEAQALGLDLQSTGGMSQIGRGKHTTRNVTLLELAGGGLLADTPGFNQPDLVMEPQELPELFPEVRQKFEEASCTFSNCRHLDEPGCIIRGDWQRYDYYVALREELQERFDLLKSRAASKKKRQGNIRYKSRAGGQMAAEVRLDPKSHRRQSRKSAKQELGSMLGDADEFDADDR